VKEESQIEDMRAAVRGDRERAEQARRRSFENVRVLTEAQHADEPAETVPSVEEPRRRGLRGFFKRR
jgi:hypothetical protein